MDSKGANGLSGDSGYPAPEAGSFSGTGFAPADGLSGKKGYPGQGGGGGGASKGNGTCLGASGGAGGMGGDAGLPGNGGRGGGASVGLFSWASKIMLTDSQIATAEGGAGGDGGNGGGSGIGSTGGAGGDPVSDPSNVIGAGGPGGRGGNGGLGGPGFGWHGRPSYAVVYRGSKPVYDSANTTLNIESGGAGGIGAQSGGKADDGTEGASEPEFEVQ